MSSRDAVESNVAKIAALFPHCVTECKPKLMGGGKSLTIRIDWDKLRAELDPDLILEGEERYQFTWPDKRAASRLANESTNLTLRPCREESVGKDGTPGGFDSENLYIEGDNLDVLKVIRETYLGCVKMIYIDPPYNTGNDFVYNDDFAQSKEDFEQSSGLFDTDGNQTIDRMQRNTEANGRFHTDWLNMIYPRLKVARDLLSEDGVIFISIDDNEQENLRKVCDEIFGAQNFVAQLIWERAFAPKNDAKFISNSHDYVVMYARSINSFKIGRLPRTVEADARYSNPDNDPRGVWQSDNLTVKTYSPSGDYPITTPSGRIVEPPAGRCWRLSAKAFAERLQDNRIWFGSDGNGVPRIKRFLSELKFEGMAPTSILFYKDVGHSQEGAQEVNKLMEAGVFDGPKPQRLMARLLTIANLDNDSIILDFFSGSGSMGHAVMKYNAEKNKHCKFILVQLPEETDDKAKKAGYENICEIGKERIRRAGEQICRDAIHSGRGNQGNSNSDGLFNDEASKQNANLPDIGFRVLTLASSNMEDVFYTPDKFEPSLLDSLVDNIKPDRSGEDLLFQVMLELGIELSAKIERKEIAGKEVFSVGDDFLLACFDTDVNETTIEEMAKLLPIHLVIRDASAANDNVLDNFEQIIESYSNEKKITTHIL